LSLQIKPSRRVLLAEQYNLGDGRRATFVVWEGDNITETARCTPRKFDAQTNVSLTIRL